MVVRWRDVVVRWRENDCEFPVNQSIIPAPTAVNKPPGRHNETRFGYFDMTSVIGTLTEIVYLQPEEKAFMQGLKRET